MNYSPKNSFMKTLLPLLLTVFCLSNIFSQNKKQYIQTEQQNYTWVCDFKSENSENRIEFLRARLKSDQDVYFSRIDWNCGTTLKEGFKGITYTRPLYIIKSKNSAPFFLPDNPSKKVIGELSRVLKSENIYAIDLKEDEISKVIYGSRGAYGIIMITLHDNEHYQKLEELIYDPT